ncbi:hypothetical protein DFP72DRAFT_849720 [Ephemerocybe angulata]|uniref:Uncharacterized protein n=1 Tax=Ephemerocybe angulata TaxID=980116 RepID=A0A8H6M209_9AGAR|nr:hypothetical protein DFP72DRAFT_849720 [Tulosesus angulatus]
MGIAVGYSHPSSDERPYRQIFAAFLRIVGCPRFKYRHLHLDNGSARASTIRMVPSLGPTRRAESTASQIRPMSRVRLLQNGLRFEVGGLSLHFSRQWIIDNPLSPPPPPRMGAQVFAGRLRLGWWIESTEMLVPAPRPNARVHVQNGFREPWLGLRAACSASELLGRRAGTSRTPRFVRVSFQLSRLHLDRWESHSGLPAGETMGSGCYYGSDDLHAEPNPHPNMVSSYVGWALLVGSPGFGSLEPKVNFTSGAVHVGGLPFKFCRGSDVPLPLFTKRSRVLEAKSKGWEGRRDSLCYSAGVSGLRRCPTKAQSQNEGAL